MEAGYVVFLITMILVLGTLISLGKAVVNVLIALDQENTAHKRRIVGGGPVAALLLYGWLLMLAGVVLPALKPHDRVCMTPLPWFGLFFSACTLGFRGQLNEIFFGADDAKK